MTNWQTKSIEWTIKDVGAPLLDSITRSLYSKLDVFREYVQNAVDSYVGFQRVTGIAPQNDVQVRVDSRNSSLFIMDHGLGMDWTDIDTAKKIAVSPKLERSTEFVGFRGIGIWSGLSACEKLVVTTTKYGNPFEYRLTIDCKGIVAQYSIPISIDELLVNRVKIEERTGDKSEHYTQVALYQVNRDSSELLDMIKITQYAEQSLPVPFDPNWKDEEGFSYAQQIAEIIDDVPWTTTYNLTINSTPVYRRFPSAKFIQRPTKEIILDSKRRQVAVAWVCETRREGSKKGVIDTSDGSVSNFAIRIRNFSLGVRGLYSDEGTTDPQNLEWYVGEIYITDPNVRPDTNRSKFQSNERYDEAVQAIRKFYTSTALRARGLSAQLSAQRKCQEAREKINELETVLSQQPLFDGAKAVRFTKVSELFQELERFQDELNDILFEMNRKDDPDNEAERALIIRRYYRKKELRESVEATVGQISTVLQEHTESIVKMSAEYGDIATTTPTRARKSKARTKKLKGIPVSPKNAVGVQPATASSGEQDASTSSALSQQKLVDLDTVIEALKAAAAAVLGEHTEGYQRIIERLPEELRRRGIDVQPQD